MSEIVAGGAPAPESAVTQVVDPTVPVVPAPVVEHKPDPLAKIIASQREERAARQAEAAKAKDYQSKLDQAQVEIAELKRSQAFEDDPVSYAKARKWSPEVQALVGQSLLYDLVPDKAPPDIRQRLFEQKQARKEAEQARMAQEQAEAQAQEQASQQFSAYSDSLMEAVKAMGEESAPESTSWFGDDHETYQRSLMATAQNLATAARQAGKQADLSPENVSKVLEQEIAGRTSAYGKRVAARTAKAAAKAQADKQTASSDTASTKGMVAGGPSQPAATDKERMERAIAAGFRNK